MGLSSQYPLNLLVGDDAVVWGTAAIGSLVGQVRSASAKRTADPQEILGPYGSLRSLVLSKPRFELTLQILFDADATAPGIGDAISFPLAEVAGRIVDVSPEWSEDGARLLNIEASWWDAMDVADAHTAYYGSIASWAATAVGNVSGVINVTTVGAAGLLAGEFVRVAGVAQVGGGAWTETLPDPNGIFEITFSNGSTLITYDIGSGGVGSYDATAAVVSRFEWAAHS